MGSPRRHSSSPSQRPMPLPTGPTGVHHARRHPSCDPRWSADRRSAGTCDARFAKAWWHSFFFAQPAKPERAILADPDAWYGGSPDQMGDEAYEDFRTAIHDPATVHGMIEDYRAGLGIDREHDEADRRAGRRISYPTLVLWSLRDDLEQLYGDVLAVWRPLATSFQGRGIDCGHHMAEEAPDDLARELLAFLART
jgi:haloacetate dehalogenase